MLLLMMMMLVMNCYIGDVSELFADALGRTSARYCSTVSMLEFHYSVMCSCVVGNVFVRRIFGDDKQTRYVAVLYFGVHAILVHSASLSSSLPPHALQYTHKSSFDYEDIY